MRKRNLLFILLGIALLMPAKLFADSIPLVVYNSDSKTLTFTWGDDSSVDGTSVFRVPNLPASVDRTTAFPKNVFNNATKVVFDSSFSSARPTSTAFWFSSFEKLETIEGIENLNTSDVTNMKYMFCMCGKLKSLDVSGFNTEKVTDMSRLFGYCYLLTSLDVSHFNTDNVTDMSGMFAGLIRVTSLDVSGFNTERVKSMSMMFLGCSSLATIDLSNFKTDSVVYMGSMFHSCSFKSLDLSSFNTSNVKDMSHMFQLCGGLKSLKLSGFKTDKVEDMSYMFSDCTGLQDLDLSNFNTDNVTDMNSMFYNCPSLESLNISSFNTSKVTNMQYMFCRTALKTLNLSNFNTVNVKDMSGMFGGIDALQSLDLSSFDTRNVTNMRQMFGCKALSTLTFGENFKTDSVSNMAGMFSGCAALTSLDISGFTINEGTDVTEMFSGCSALNTLSLGDNDFANISVKDQRLFKNVGTVEKPCQLLVGKGFNATVLGYRHEGNPNYYNWHGGYFYGDMDSGIHSIVQSITISSDTVRIAKGETYNLVATVLPSDASSILNFTTKSDIVSVSDYGVIRAIKDGNADVRVEATDGSGVYAVCHVIVYTKVQSITLSDDTVRVVSGGTYSLKTTVLPDNASQIVKFSTDNDDIASVDDEGVITAKNTGETNVRAEATDGSGIYSVCHVIVYPKVQSITLYADTVRMLVNDTCNLNITVFPTDATQKVNITTDNYVVKIVDGEGTITGERDGEAIVRIEATDGSGVYAVCHVFVFPKGTVYADGICYNLDAEKREATVVNPFKFSYSSSKFYKGVVTIPQTITYNDTVYTVTSIDYGAFSKQDITGLNIPSTVKEMGLGAAADSKSLQRVTIEDNSMLTSLGYDTFQGCDSLLEVVFNGTAPNYNTVGADLFNGCKNLTHFEIPSTTENIGPGAFYGCESLSSITIPENIQWIGDSCFENCTSLNTVTFMGDSLYSSIYDTRNNLLAIHKNAFRNCPNITWVNISSIDRWANIDFENAEANPASISHHIYLNGEDVTYVNLSSDFLYHIGSNAFNGCTAIKSIDIPEYVSSIGDDIFAGCSSLNSVYVRNDFVPRFTGVNDPSTMDDVFNRATLYVPIGHENDYKNDSWWGRFYKIEGFNKWVSGILSVSLNVDDSETVYYTVNGLKIGSKVMQPGVYIRVKNGKSEKVFINKK